MASQQASPSHTILLTNATSVTTRLGEDRTRITTTLSIGIKKDIDDKRISMPLGGPSVNMTQQKNPQKTTLQMTATILIVALQEDSMRYATPIIFHATQTLWEIAGLK
jgi:hypothetical protein